MENNISIELMTETDLAEVVLIGKNTRQLQIDDHKNMYYEPESVAKAIKSPSEVCLVAKVNDQLAGFFIAHINEVFNEVYLSDMVLKPEYRGQGIGQMLITKAREILKPKNIDWSWALVQDDNLPMHHFMEKQGYIKGKKFYFFYKPSGF